MKWSDHNPRPLTFLLLLFLVVVLGVAMFPGLIRQGDSRAITVGLIVLALSGLLVLWDMRRARRRMQSLEEVAKALENGDYSVRSEIGGSDAVAKLPERYRSVLNLHLAYGLLPHEIALALAPSKRLSG